MKQFEKIYKGNDLNKLVGKTISEISLSVCKEYIQFKINEGLITWFTDQDCCSESWIEHVTLPFGFENSDKSFEVISIEEIDLGEVVPTRQEVDQLYGLKILGNIKKWGNSEIYIEFRNSSNGYYGGSMEPIELLNDSDVIFKELKESI